MSSKPFPLRKRMIQIVLWLVMFGVTGYLALVLILFTAQRHLLYHTQGSLPSPEAPMQAVSVPTADGHTLTAWYAPPRRPDGLVVLHVHGNSGTIADRSHKAQRFLTAGFGVLWQEYRGFAGMPGHPTEDGLYEDGRGALRWLSEQAGVPAGRVVLYGESLGTGVAVQLASETTPAALMLEAPYTSIPEVAARQYPFVPVRWLVLDRYDSLAKIARVTAPLLVVHGERDRVIPVGQAKLLFAAARDPKRLVLLPEAGHADLFSWGAGEAMQDFLATLPRSTGQP